MSGYPIELDLTGGAAVVVGGGRGRAAPDPRPGRRRRRGHGHRPGGTAPSSPRSDVTMLDQALPGRRPGRRLARARRDRRPRGQRGRRRRRRASQDLVRSRRRRPRRRRPGCPAVTRHGDVTVAVTAGGDPRRSQRLARPRSVHKLAPGRTAGPPAPPPPASGQGHVALVGGGPGDPGLMTVLGRRLLAEADVVVADRLGPRDVLAELDPDVEIIEAGKAPGAHRLTQEQINELIVARALAGNRVVRLKGGDPFVFGRGGEEALACVRAGVPVQVVPGVTSAIAVPGLRRDPGHAPGHHPGLRGGLRAPRSVPARRVGRLGRAGGRSRHPGPADGHGSPGADHRRADQARPGRAPPRSR